MRLNIYLSNDDYDRYIAIKRITGDSDWDLEEYARVLLHNALFKKFPAIPVFDDDDHLLNADRYIG